MRTGKLWELAALPDMPSEPTLRTFLRARPDFPVLQVGGNGHSYLFDLDAAAAFVRANWRDSRPERAGLSPARRDLAAHPVKQRTGKLWELAALPGMPSQPTLRAFVSVRPDFPVIRHGSKGVSYLFDLDVAAAFVRANWRDSRSAVNGVARGGRDGRAMTATIAQHAFPGLFDGDEYETREG